MAIFLFHLSLNKSFKKIEFLKREVGIDIKSKEISS